MEDCETPLKKHKVNPEDINDNVKNILVKKVVNDAQNCNNRDSSAICQINEESYGISKYINKSNGFSGIIKQRYSDFIVNEINLEGEIVHLTNTLFKNIETTEEEVDDKTTLDSDQLKDLEVFQSTADTLAEFLIQVECISKEERTKIHKEIKKIYTNLDSSTEMRNDKQCIVVKYKLNVQQRQGRIFNSKVGDYCKFVLYKENKDTQECLNYISKQLRVKTSVFSFAGTKDRRAKTTQEITAFRIEPNRLSGLNKRLRNIVMGNFRICSKEMKLGDLSGNFFTITLRNVIGTEADISASLLSLKENGFINYFGMQRFGTTDVPTHHVGKAILASNWLETIDLILKPRLNDRKEMAEMRASWQETKDAKLALKQLSYFQCVERKLLEGIVKYTLRDPLACLNCIPRNTRLMYVHAYQSYVFNRVASMRIQAHGMNVVPGDLVFEGSIKDKEVPTEKPIKVEEKMVHNYQIKDIVLPLPGYDVEYPDYLKECYNSILLEDSMQDFNFKHKNRDYSLPGCYRKLIIIPKQFSWYKTTYTDSTIALVKSDLDHLNEVNNGKLCAANEQISEPNLLNEDTDDLVDLIEDGDDVTGNIVNNEIEDKADIVKTAIVLEFSLPSSTYATMVLREVLKQDTSSAFQTTLNKT